MHIGVGPPETLESTYVSSYCVAPSLARERFNARVLYHSPSATFSTATKPNFSRVNARAALPFSLGHVFRILGGGSLARPVWADDTCYSLAHKTISVLNYYHTKNRPFANVILFWLCFRSLRRLPVAGQRLRIGRQPHVQRPLRHAPVPARGLASGRRSRHRGGPRFGHPSCRRQLLPTQRWRARGGQPQRPLLHGLRRARHRHVRSPEVDQRQSLQEAQEVRRSRQARGRRFPGSRATDHLSHGTQEEKPRR